MPIHLTRTPQRRVLLIALAAALAAPTATAWASTSEPQFQAAWAQFQAAQQGDSSATTRAAEQFAELLKADPGQPALMAYAGAATAMRAGTTFLPWKKLGYAEDGLAQIDKALSLLQPTHDTARLNHVAVSLQTRFTAASTFLALPAVFKRGERGARLLHEVQTSPLLAQSPAAFQAAVAALAARRAQAAGKQP